MPPTWRNMYTEYSPKKIKLWHTYFKSHRKARSYELHKLKDKEFKKV